MKAGLPKISVSVISSICVAATNSPPGAPIERALGELRRMEVEYADLYCFFPTDLSGEGPLVAQMADLNVNGLIEEWRSRPDIAEYVNNRRVRALASNLPNISSSVREKNRETVRALKKLLTLASAIGAPVLEIVAGPDFVRAANDTFQVGARAIKSRRDALLAALRALDSYACELDPPVVLALEMEPGISYLLNSWTEVQRLFADLEPPRGRALSRVQLNLDIGHACLLARNAPSMLEDLKREAWRRRIAHAHISHHVHHGHMADLPLKPEHESIYRPWIDLVVDAWYLPPGNPLASHAIALELEAPSSMREVATSVDWLRRWVEDSRRRYERDAKWRKKMLQTIAVVDLAGYSTLARTLEETIGVNAAAQLNQQIQDMILRALSAKGMSWEDHVAKTTGDGAILVFENSILAHDFGVSLLSISAEHNQTVMEPLAKRRFRIGIATGEVVPQTAPDGSRDLAGIAISNAVRLETAAEPEQIVTQDVAYRSLPGPAQALYGREEEVPGKRAERFLARRYPAPAIAAASAPHRPSSAPTPTRRAVVDSMSGLDGLVLEKLIILIEMPADRQPSKYLPAAERNLAVLNWALSAQGCGQARLWEELTFLADQDARAARA